MVERFAYTEKVNSSSLLLLIKFEEVNSNYQKGQAVEFHIDNDLDLLPSEMIIL